MNAATDEIYQRLRKQLDDALNADKRLANIAEKIKRKQATLADTAEYSEIVANHIAAVLQAAVGDIRSPLGKELVCRELLRDHYAAINDVLGTVQAIVDEQREIHIRPQQAAFPAERVQKVAHALEDPTVSLDIIRRRANAPVANVAKSFHDDYIKENAKFRADAGLKCWITRHTDGNCCKWCTKAAGRYLYEDQPENLWRRHDNCGCTILYDTGRTVQTLRGRHKKWEVVSERTKEYKPTILTPAQGRALQAKHKPTVLTRGSRSGIIKSLDIDDFKMIAEGHGIDPEALEVIASVVSEYEKSGLVHIDDFYFGSLANTATGTPLLQIDPIADRTLRLNVNTVWFNGKTLSDIDSALKAYEKNLAVSLREAVIHEMGHAKAIKGMTLKDIRDFYAEIRDAKVKDVSKIAYNDGAEALAEIEILISRGSDIPQAAIEFYNKYMRRK